MDISMLKTHLGDELYSQVEEKLGGLDGFHVIATNDGSWLPKTRLDAEISKRKDLQTTINGLTAELNEAKKNLEDSSGLQAKVEQLTRDVAERDGTITTMRRSGKIRELLQQANVRDVHVVERLLDEAQITEDEKGNIQGVAEQLNALKEHSAYLFNESGGLRAGFGADKQPHAGDPGSNSDVNSAIRRAAGRI